jgi:Kef-type K+ transport system membrane component KefB
MGTTGIDILMIGGIVVAAVLLKSAFDVVGLPDVLGYLGIGVALSVIDARWTLVDQAGRDLLHVMEHLGLFALLFRFGLESSADRLVRRLPRASLVWMTATAASLVLVFGAAYGVLEWAMVPSLFVAVALSATSIGTAARVWAGAGRLRSPCGDLLLDVAELDDLSGVLLLALLVSVAPQLQAGHTGGVWQSVGATLALQTALLAALTAGCVAFARFAEAPLTSLVRRVESRADTVVFVVGVGLLVTAAALLMGFSVAIGAFFAGLVFSSDPEASGIDASFDVLYDLFVPFFFVGIGFALQPSALPGTLAPLGVLLVAAVVAKVAGGAAGLLPSTDAPTALLFGVSLVPRAEVALVVMQRGLALGSGAVPPQAFAVVVLIVALTIALTPILLRTLIRRDVPGAGWEET